MLGFAFPADAPCHIDFVTRLHQDRLQAYPAQLALIKARQAQNSRVTLFSPSRTCRERLSLADLRRHRRRLHTGTPKKTVRRQKEARTAHDSCPPLDCTATSALITGLRSSVRAAGLLLNHCFSARHGVSGWRGTLIVPGHTQCTFWIPAPTPSFVTHFLDSSSLCPLYRQAAAGEEEEAIRKGVFVLTGDLVTAHRLRAESTASDKTHILWLSSVGVVVGRRDGLALVTERSAAERLRRDGLMTKVQVGDKTGSRRMPDGMAD